MQASSRKKVHLSGTIVVIDSDKAQVSQRNKGIRFNYTFLFFYDQSIYEGSNIKNGLIVKQLAK